MKINWMNTDINHFIEKKDILFQNFSNISDFRYLELIKYVQEKNNNYLQYETSKYYQTFDFFFGNTSKDNEFTYDELVTILILLFDSNLNIYKTYLSIINKRKNSYDIKKDLCNLYKHIGQLFFEKSSINNTTKILTNSLIYFEEIYFNHFFNKEKLPINFNKKHFDNLLQSKDIDFTKLDQNKLNHIKNLLSKWNHFCILGNSHLLLSYHLENELAFFNNLTIEEKIAILIIAIDPDLLLLKTYYNESIWDNIKNYSLTNYGFFNRNFILLENKFNEALNLISNNWSLTYKMKDN